MTWHPSSEQLELYAIGGVEGDARAHIYAHLGGCASCLRATISESALDDVLAQVADDCAFCPACERVAAGDRCDYCGCALVVAGYTILEARVQNAHGRLYRARDAAGEVVALKELCFHQPPSVKVVESFEREARFLRALSHPRLPRFVASFSDGVGNQQRMYLAQQFVDGVSLEARLAEHYFSEPEIVDIARQTLEVLVFLQSLSPMVFHRDIKPANLIRRPDGTIVVVDFGAARDDGTSAGTTQVGTFGYMPVEQLAGLVDQTTDGFALGASLLHLLTRRPPWHWLDGELPALNVSPALRRFLLKLTARKPDDRFASAIAAHRAALALEQPRRRRAMPRLAGLPGLAAMARVPTPAWLVAGGLGFGALSFGLAHHFLVGGAAPAAAPAPAISSRPDPTPLVPSRPAPNPYGAAGPVRAPFPQGPVTMPVPSPYVRKPNPPRAQLTPPAMCHDGDCALWIDVAPYEMNSGFMQPQIKADAITVEAWMKPVTNLEVDWPHGLSLSFDHAGTIGAWTFFDMVDNGRGASDRFEVTGDATPATHGKSGWHHVAYSYDRKQVVLYVDAKPVAMHVCNGRCWPMELQWSITFSGGGAIDEVQVYNTAHTAAQIAVDAHARPRLDDPSLVTYYSFDGPGTLAPTDLTGHNGSLRLFDHASRSSQYFRVADQAPVK